MKKIFLILFFTFCFFWGFAQQIPVGYIYVDITPFLKRNGINIDSFIDSLYRYGINHEVSGKL